MNFINKYIQILKKQRGCTRKDFWSYYGFMWGIFALIFVMEIVLKSFYHYGFNYNFYSFFYAIIICFLSIVCFLLQIKRLQDANISPWILLLYLFGILGKAFSFLVSIIIVVCLCLPSQEMPNTDLLKRTENK